MLTVEVDTITATNSGIWLGCVVRYGEHGPVRFARAHVGIELLTPATMDDMARLFIVALDRFLEAEREADPDPALPGM